MDDFGDRNSVTCQQVQTRIANEQTAQKKRTQKIIKKNSCLIRTFFLRYSLIIVNGLLI